MMRSINSMHSEEEEETQYIIVVVSGSEVSSKVLALLLSDIIG
jgi:hypothetical protein